jgi:hypothetical protein
VERQGQAMNLVGNSQSGKQKEQREASIGSYLSLIDRQGDNIYF